MLKVNKWRRTRRTLKLGPRPVRSIEYEPAQQGRFIKLPETPDLIAARWACHDIYGEEMPAIAANLLEAGYDTPSLRRLAGELQIRCSADAEPLVRKVFHELGIRYPLSERQARLITARQIAKQVIAGEIDPWAAAYRIEIRVCKWIPSESELETIFMLSDEKDWDTGYGRPASTLEEALVQTFARLAAMSDESIFAKS